WGRDAGRGSTIRGNGPLMPDTACPVSGRRLPGGSRVPPRPHSRNAAHRARRPASAPVPRSEAGWLTVGSPFPERSDRRRWWSPAWAERYSRRRGRSVRPAVPRVAPDESLRSQTTEQRVFVLQVVEQCVDPLDGGSGGGVVTRCR